jgi:enoyl-CoA hydratase/carnithine racemase
MLETQVHPHDVCELRLAKPPVNALGPALVTHLNAQLTEALQLHSAIVLSGQPGLFTGGLDVRELALLGPGELQDFLLRFLQLQRIIACSERPVIAAITGHSPAGGTVMALFCDYRIMARGAFRIGLNEVQVGLTPGEIIYRAFERLVGPRIGADWATRGVLVDPEVALQAGLVDELAEPGVVIARAIAYAQELVALPKLAFQVTRRTVRADLVALFDERRCAALVAQVSELWLSGETRQRMAQVLQKAR